MKPHLRVAIATLLEAGASQREIERRTGIGRRTIRRCARRAESPTLATGSQGSTGPPPGPTPPPWPPASREPGGAEGVSAAEPGPAATSIPVPAAAADLTGWVVSCVSACAAHREWIEAQVQMGCNAVSICQDLVETRGFEHACSSAKRFVARLRARDLARFDVLEFLPGEEAQVDFGKGAPTPYEGRNRRPWLFVMTLKYSGKSFPHHRLEGRPADLGTPARGCAAPAAREGRRAWCQVSATSRSSSAWLPASSCRQRRTT